MPTFISYSHRDSALHSSLCLALKAEGISFWKKEGLRQGRLLAHELQQVTQRCDECLFLATRNSLRSDWCRAELGAFWGAGKRVIVFMADSQLKDSDLPEELQGVLWTDDAQVTIEALKNETGKRWMTKWKLGSYDYLEYLTLKQSESNRIFGERRTERNDGKTSTYRVSGLCQDGFWWLEYHGEPEKDDEDRGGGTIVGMRETTWMFSGVITSTDCKRRKINCRANQWVTADRIEEYEARWQLDLGAFEP